MWESFDVWRFFSEEALVGMRSFPLIFPGLLCPLAST